MLRNALQHVALILWHPQGEMCRSSRLDHNHLVIATAAAVRSEMTRIFAFVTAKRLHAQCGASYGFENLNR